MQDTKEYLENLKLRLETLEYLGSLVFANKKDKFKNLDKSLLIRTHHLKQLNETLYHQGTTEEQNLYITFLYTLWSKNDSKAQKRFFDFETYFNEFL